MSGLGTQKLIGVYTQMAPPTRFLTGEFKSPPQNFFDTEEVEIDIDRSGEDVSIAIQDVSAGYRMNKADDFTNKKFKPPTHKEAIPLNAFDLMKRFAGQNPFESNNFQAKAILKIFNGVRKNDAKIRRAIELQASQVLQLGIVTLPDETGATIYTIDYRPKVTHFPTSAIVWGQVGADPLADLAALANVIRSDGLSSPMKLMFGEKAFDEFMQDAKVQNNLNNRRMNVGEIAPVSDGQGATSQGHIWIGNYKFEMWTYSGRFKAIQGGASTPYITTGKVIMTSGDQSQMDLAFGAIPSIVPPDSRVLPFLPSRIVNGEGRMDIALNAWVDAAGENLFAGSSSRPICIPTAIDTYGCLNTGLV